MPQFTVTGKVTITITSDTTASAARYVRQRIDSTFPGTDVDDLQVTESVPLSFKLLHEAYVEDTGEDGMPLVITASIAPGAAQVVWKAIASGGVSYSDHDLAALLQHVQYNWRMNRCPQNPTGFDGAGKRKVSLQRLLFLAAAAQRGRRA